MFAISRCMRATVCCTSSSEKPSNATAFMSSKARLPTSAILRPRAVGATVSDQRGAAILRCGGALDELQAFQLAQ